MTVTIEPLAIGSIDGPRVWILIRQVGRHKDIEEMPDTVTDESSARAFAAKRWQVAEREVNVAELQVVFWEDQA